MTNDPNADDQDGCLTQQSSTTPLIQIDNYKRRSLYPESTMFRSVPDINKPPFYVKRLDDHLRIGSFVHIHLPGQKDDTTIARIHSGINATGLRFVLFPPLFPRYNLNDQSHPKLPKHNYTRVMLGLGSRNTELYESSTTFDVVEDASSVISHPAFVFSLHEFKSPKNIWTEGLDNFFFVRFRMPIIDSDPPVGCLHPLEEKTKLCFPNEHACRFIVDKAVPPPRCFHQSSFVGLFLLRKALVKLLNKSSGQAEEHEVTGDTIGLVPTETWTYIVQLCRIQGIDIHTTKGSASYLDIDPKFTRKKVKISYPTTIIRFRSSDDLQFLRGLLGFGSTYGCTDRKPTLADGPNGTSFKPEHRVTLVKGSTSEEKENFKVRSRDQQVDLCWSDFHCRVVVGYEQYQYSLDHKGKLKNDPPTEDLKNILQGTPTSSDDKTDTTDVYQHEPSDTTESDSEPSKAPSPASPNKIAKSTAQDSPSSRIKIGHQFTDWDEQNVYEVIAVNRNENGPFVVSRIIGGVFYDHDLPMDQQEIHKWEDADEVLLLIRQFN